MAHEKDPFAEYDKYWDELDQIEEKSNKQQEKQYEYYDNKQYGNQYKQLSNKWIGVIVGVILLFVFARFGIFLLFFIPQILFVLFVFFIVKNVIKK